MKYYSIILVTAAVSFAFPRAVLFVAVIGLVFLSLVEKIIPRQRKDVPRNEGHYEPLPHGRRKFVR